MIGRWIAPAFPPPGAHRNEFMREFARQVSAVPGRRGRVLDIGCGEAAPYALRDLVDGFGALDGVDPDPAIARHTRLSHRWQAHFESAPLPAGAYDLAYAYNVLEHIADPRVFFTKVASVLAPGGVFIALAPNARHPFAWVSRLVEALHLKPLLGRSLGRRAEFAMRVNAYPSYYRCNSPAAIQRAIGGLDLSATFTFVPCVQWEMYFPRWLRWVPFLWDRIVSAHVENMNQIVIVRLERRSHDLTLENIEGHGGSKPLV